MEKLEKEAIEILQVLCAYDNCVISDSGGKDSSVLKHIALKAREIYGLNFKVRHNHTTVDAPETVYFVREEKEKFEKMGIEYEISYPKETMWQLIVRHGTPPTRRMPKTEKKRETSPSQSNLNDKNARRYLIRLANINFGKGDIWATFGWNNGLLPETYEDAKKDVVNFIRRINRKRKKLGLENAKYIYIIAFEEYTRPHFHLLISGGIDRDELERMWGKCDRPNTRNISPDENFLLTGLATYITQNPHGTKRWCPSKNLKKPDEPKRSYSKFRKAKVEKMAFDSSVLQAEMEKAYPGFTFLDAEVKHNGVNAAFYIYARMVKKGEKPKGKLQKRKRGNKA